MDEQQLRAIEARLVERDRLVSGIMDLPLALCLEIAYHDANALTAALRAAWQRDAALRGALEHLYDTRLFAHTHYPAAATCAVCEAEEHARQALEPS